MTATFTCPRRAGDGTDRPNDPRTWCGPNQDHWSGGTCHYCGSIPPDVFMARVKAGVEIGPTDKNYKAYIKGVGGNHEGKFYFQHLTDDQRNEFIDLLNAKTVNVGYPGHFYVLPFFATRAPVVEA